MGKKLSRLIEDRDALIASGKAFAEVGGEAVIPDFVPVASEAIKELDAEIEDERRRVASRRTAKDKLLDEAIEAARLHGEESDSLDDMEVSDLQDALTEAWSYLKLKHAKAVVKAIANQSKKKS